MAKVVLSCRIMCVGANKKPNNKMVTRHRFKEFFKVLVLVKFYSAMSALLLLFDPLECTLP